MNKITFYLIVLSIIFVNQVSSLCSYAGNEIPAYYKIANVEKDLPAVVSDVKAAISASKFKIIGEYHPGNEKHLFVLAITRDDLQDIVLQKEDRGLLASVLKIGFHKSASGVEVSIINPMYLFNAYLQEGIESNISKLQNISNELINALNTVGPNLVAFGGSIEDEDLWDYHYMLGMPYFTDPVELASFESFEKGLALIQKNLKSKVGNTLKVYEIIRSDKKVAVFGIGLLDKESGESHFLPIIGENHVAAMPYEIILQGKEVTMLHGRYRIALHWPELTMATFTKIMSTPGYIEDTFQKIVE